MSRVQRKKSHDRATVKEIVEHFAAHPVLLSERDSEALLSELCVSLGYCLTPADWSKIIENPPTDPKGFADLVMELEGVGTSDPELYEPVFRKVVGWFVRVSERAT
jgi:hypothetical protein